MATLYLNPEGILHPPYAAPRQGTDSSDILANNVVLFEEVLRAFSSTAIVLHSWYVFQAGYREALWSLPSIARAHVVGATIPGNRLYRFNQPAITARREWLRADLQRRRPSNPILLDTDWGQVLPSLCESSLIVEGRKDLTVPNVAESLRSLLRAADTAKATSDQRFLERQRNEEQS